MSGGWTVDVGEMDTASWAHFSNNLKREMEKTGALGLLPGVVSLLCL